MARIELIDIAHAYSYPSSASRGASHPNLPPQAGEGVDPLAGEGIEDWALKPMTMTWADAGAYALLGPSGCGKTTLLNIISGLITPTRGQVLFDGRDVTRLAPQERNIAQVFQFPVVYDTMTVFDNLAFPLRNRRWSGAKIKTRVHEVAEILELLPDLPRRAQGLSADARQKISLGRGLVRPDVAAVLFDEPLTVIDPHLKWLLRRKLKQIHQQLRLSLIYVTHDQTEALTFADQVVVMTAGEVVQIGTPQELFETPAHRFVGHFIGSPGMNFLACRWRDGMPRLGDTPIATASVATPPDGAALSLGIRPEFVELVDSAGANCVPAQIHAIRDQGVNAMVQLQVESAHTVRLWAKLRNARNVPSAGHTFIHLPASRCALYADDRRVA
jgi:glycerol transport system ATP-binding protein